MTKTKSTKRALLMSALSLLMCVSMLIGSTFAWFTDSVTSGSNVITAGNLDIEVQYTIGEKDDAGKLKWENLDGADDLFQKGLWEPGHTEVVVLRIKNNGSLALKYVANMNIVNETVGKTKDGADIVLSDILTVKTLTFADADVHPLFGFNIAQKTIEEAFKAESSIAYGDAATFKNGNILEGNEKLLPNEIQYIAIEVDIAETVGNEANHNGTDIPKINFGINVMATQFTYENDSFGNQYDEGLDPTAEYLFSGADIHNSTTKSGKFKLSRDIKTSDHGDEARYGYGYEYIIRKGADYTLDLNGKTIVHDTVNKNANNNALTYLFVANNPGTKLTINGDGKIYSNNSEGYTCAVQGKDGTLVTLNGGDFQVDNGIAVWAGAGSHIVINDGSYVNGNAKTDHELIYSSGGVIDIYGGFFHNTDGNYTLNVEDRNRATGFINVYGGTYVNFDPSTGGQDPNNIRVADGYMVTSETQGNGDIWYTVVPVPEGYEVVSTESEMVEALESGDNVVLADNISLSSAVAIAETVEIDLNGKELTVMGMDFNAGATIQNGTITSGGHTNLVPHLKVTGGNLIMNDVTVGVNHHLNANVNWAEATGMEVQNATATLNNCNIKIDNPTGAKWVYSYGISLNNANLTVNGGSITAECVAGTAANGPTNPNAISSMGECTVTLNNVDVEATYYATTVNGHLTINTTDTSVTSSDIVDNRGGSHTLNYID